MRQALRVGVRLGLLGVLVLAVLKLVRARRADEEWEDDATPWPPVQPMVEVETPAVATAPGAGVKKASTTTAAGTPAKNTPAAKKKAPAPAGVPSAWVAPEGRVCPESHPVKAKLTSRIFHLPGMAAYNRTTPDRCYPDESSAVEDGFTKAQR